MATPGKSVPQHDRDKAQSLKANGTPISEIARRLMLSRPTVRKILGKTA